MANKPIEHYGKWRIRWTDAEGKRRSESYVLKKDAELALKRHEVEAEEAIRGLRCVVSSGKKFSHLCDYWIRHRVPTKRSGKKDESFIRRELRPSFGHLKLDSIGADQVERFKTAMSQRLSKKTVNLHLGLLISMLNLAIELGWVADRPKIRKFRLPTFAEDYNYLRTLEDRDRFLRAAQEQGPLFYNMHALAIYTGLRAGEIPGLRWSHVDFNKRLITVQRGFGGPTKAGDVRHVPILDALLPILRDWRLPCPGELVFPNEAGNMHDASGRIFQEKLKQCLETAELPQNLITFHGLRHSFASYWMMAGGDLFKLQKILGHKSVSMTMRYAHLAPNAFAEDYARFGQTEREPGKLIQIIKS